MVPNSGMIESHRVSIVIPIERSPPLETTSGVEDE